MTYTGIAVVAALAAVALDRWVMHTRLTASGEAEATGLYKLLAPILVRTLKRHSQDDLANVKRILEASVAAN